MSNWVHQRAFLSFHICVLVYWAVRWGWLNRNFILFYFLHLTHLQSNSSWSLVPGCIITIMKYIIQVVSVTGITLSTPCPAWVDSHPEASVLVELRTFWMTCGGLRKSQTKVALGHSAHISHFPVQKLAANNSFGINPVPAICRANTIPFGGVYLCSLRRGKVCLQE